MIKSYSLKHKIKGGENRKRPLPLCESRSPLGRAAVRVQSRPAGCSRAGAGLDLRPLVMKSHVRVLGGLPPAPLLPSASPRALGSRASLRGRLCSSAASSRAPGQRTSAASLNIVCVVSVGSVGRSGSICLSFWTCVRVV